MRTSDAAHAAVVATLLERVWERGDVYKAAYAGAYCVGCEEYKDADGMDTDGNCLVHRTPCPQRQEVRKGGAGVQRRACWHSRAQ